MSFSILYFASDYPELFKSGKFRTSGKIQRRRGWTYASKPSCGHLFQQFRKSISADGIFSFCFWVLATGSNAQTTLSREYIHVGTRVIAVAMDWTYSY